MVGVGRGEEGEKRGRGRERVLQYPIHWNLFFKVSYFNYVNFLNESQSKTNVQESQWMGEEIFHTPTPLTIASRLGYSSSDRDPQKEGRAFP